MEIGNPQTLVEALVEAGVAIASLVVLILAILALIIWLRTRSKDHTSDNSFSAQLLALFAKAQANQESLTEQQARFAEAQANQNILMSSILSAIESGNETDEKTSAAIMDNTAAITRHTNEAVERHTLILDRLEVLEHTTQDRLAKLFEQVEQQGADQQSAMHDLKRAIEVMIGDLLNDVRTVRNLPEPKESA